MAPVDVVVREIGARGDGIAETPDGPLYVPATVAGDRVRVRPLERRGEGRAAALVELLEPGPGRAAPACVHFGACGGCALQHLADDAYAAWKIDRLREALARRGFDEVHLDPLVRTPPRSRRRMRLKAVRGAGRATVGFAMRESHAVVDLLACPVVVPALQELIEPLRELAQTLLPEGGRLEFEASVLDRGVDLLVVSGTSPGLAEREALAAFAVWRDLVRVAWQAGGGGAEPIAARRPATVSFAGKPVEIPPGGFLQASAAAEHALAEFVSAALPPGSRVLELFAGCGTFTLPLAAGGRIVRAAEGDAALVAALSAAAARGGLDGRIEAVRRDLARAPFGAEELDGWDAVLLDPPRSGAREQAQALAASRVPLVVYVSCSPASFGRDARILASAGFRLERVLPVDQFLWSPQLELAAVFRR